MLITLDFCLNKNFHEGIHVLFFPGLHVIIMQMELNLILDVNSYIPAEMLLAHYCFHKLLEIESLIFKHCDLFISEFVCLQSIFLARVM